MAYATFLNVSSYTIVSSGSAEKPSDEAVKALLAPLEADAADVVFAMSHEGLRGNVWLRALSRMTHWVSATKITSPFSGLMALRTELVPNLPSSCPDEEFECRAWAQLVAQQYRLGEVAVKTKLNSHLSFGSFRRLARKVLAGFPTEQDTHAPHEGYHTLAHLEAQASNYNAWLGKRFRAHCGKRVLEVGAGIGTITAQLEQGLERLVALDIEPGYIQLLRNRFRGKPHIHPYLSDVALADWAYLQQEQFDTLVLSNVLEHIPDDAQALSRFHQILPDGGKLILYVPGIPALFGSLDEAVGHHRRYNAQNLRALLISQGFSVDTLEWMNVVGIPGWFLNGRVLRRRVLPPLQLRLFDMLAPTLAKWESHVRLPIGLSLLAVATVKKSTVA